MAEPVKKQNGVLWLDKSGLSLYLENKPFIRLNFPADIFSNLEIIDRSKLQTLIHSFISQNGFGSLTLILILTADILFEKDWVIPQNDVQMKEEADFIDSLPFENIITHSWTSENKKKLIATNQDYITILKNIFEKDNCQLIAAFPYSMFGANVRNESVKDIWKKLEILKNDSLIKKERESVLERDIFNNQNDNKKGKSRSTLPLLIPVFVLLIGVLVFLLLKK